ncbi:hypothetical protein ID866_2598 [Astraeus odoratus]|nr:hypothetical protein ID866_2598 [Astraeus odoratus]
MSRPDSHGIDHLLSTNHSAADRDISQSPYPSSSAVNNMAASLDRRGSQGSSVHIAGPGTPAIPRSYILQGIQEKEYGTPFSTSVNRHTAHLANPYFFTSSHHRPSPSLPVGSSPVHTPSPSYFSTSSEEERDNTMPRQAVQPTQSTQPTSNTTSSPGNTNTNLDLLRSTLWWGGLEPWMDEEYAKQVSNLMGWTSVNVKVPSNGGTNASGQPANNPGHCFLIFPSRSVAASALNQVNSSCTLQPLLMPNSNKPFVLNWASSVPDALIASAFSAPSVAASGPHHQYHKEYSIFVGDLDPEASNSDLVAVFRNPLLGLRDDREPKFIQPFLSCKSAKIMVDPVTGLSRGYGFVRASDSLMRQTSSVHWWKCTGSTVVLARVRPSARFFLHMADVDSPVRISPATAKYKPPQSHIPLSLPPAHHPSSQHTGDQGLNSMTVLPNANQVRSVSFPIAASPSNGSPSSMSTLSSSSSALSGSGSMPSIGSKSNMNISPSVLPPNAPLGGISLNGSVAAGTTSQPSAYSPHSRDENTLPRYIFFEESWKHHVQACNIFRNLIGPNGEQLTSTDPYNTTVFVGGLSPLISEETLRTFFSPFGDIHYVKVPAGKQCGFVQFVRKTDATRAIEKMQGFPIGGSRIRLSWGRSQYKAAQAAAQAAQVAALQVQLQAQMTANPSAQLSSEQALQHLQLGLTDFGVHDTNNGIYFTPNGASTADEKTGALFTTQTRTDGANSNFLHEAFSNPYGQSSMVPDNGSQYQHPARLQFPSSFTPFSPDPNVAILGNPKKDHEELPSQDGRSDYLRKFDSTQVDASTTIGERPINSLGCVQMPDRTQKYGMYLNGLGGSRSPSHQESVARPGSNKALSLSQSNQFNPREEHDAIQDLNGTLASLNLDHNGLWKATNGTERQIHSP